MASVSKSIKSADSSAMDLIFGFLISFLAWPKLDFPSSANEVDLILQISLALLELRKKIGYQIFYQILFFLTCFHIYFCDLPSLPPDILHNNKEDCNLNI